MLLLSSDDFFSKLTFSKNSFSNIIRVSNGGPGPEVYKAFSYSTRLSRKFILLINVKMPTIVGILTFISMINTTSERLKARNFFVGILVFMSSLNFVLS